MTRPPYADPPICCIGKDKLQTMSLAQEIAKRMSRHRDLPVSAYRCPHCNFFHVGGDNKKGNSMENQSRSIESVRQDLASRLVQREVVQCVSGLMAGILEISYKVSYADMQSAFCTDSDELINLFQGQDYEEAVREFVMNDADVAQLEEMADEYGYWGNVLDDCLPELGSDDNGFWTFIATDKTFEGEDEAREAAIEHVLDDIRKGVWELINTDEEFRAVCDEYSLDPEVTEVYEHWIVSDWLARKLAEKGEITGDVMGLTIWGRCCTGQSISLDHTIREITRELWPEEWDGKEAL